MLLWWSAVKNIQLYIGGLVGHSHAQANSIYWWISGTSNSVEVLWKSSFVFRWKAGKRKKGGRGCLISSMHQPSCCASAYSCSMWKHPKTKARMIRCGCLSSAAYQLSMETVASVKEQCLRGPLWFLELTLSWSSEEVGTKWKWKTFQLC